MSVRLEVMAQKKQTKVIKNKPTPKRKRTTVIKEKLFESDSTYLLKLVIVLLLGAVWLRLATPITWLGLPLGAVPVGLIVGLIAVKLAEKHQSNRKIWYVVLIVVALVTYGADKGIVI